MEFPGGRGIGCADVENLRGFYAVEKAEDADHYDEESVKRRVCHVRAF